MTGIEIIKKLHDNNFEAYIVGGYVRDMILKEKTSDMDIATNASPDILYKIFKDFTKVYLVGRSFGVTLINGIEVSTYRKDKYFGLSDKNVEITFSDSLKEDLERRDLTINALALDIRNSKIIDYHNGLEDLKNKIIRFIGNPLDRIQEDPNRIIRACRFLAKIDGSFENETKKILRRCCKYVKKYVANERIRLEILKAMSMQKASIFFESLYDINCLQYIFPQLQKCYKHDHGKHHIEDIFTHQMICGDSITIKKPLLKLVGYLHDIGKPLTYKFGEKDKEYHFNKHEQVGANIIKDYLIKKLKFSGYEGEYIHDYIKFHMRISSKGMSGKSIRKLLKDIEKTKVNYKDLIRLSISDKKSNLKRKPLSISEIKNILKKFNKELNNDISTNSFLKLELNGNDIMELTGLSPGPKIGLILKSLSEKVIDNPNLNKKDILKSIIKEGDYV